MEPAEDAKGWYYQGMEGQVHGPQALASMQAWFLHDQLPRGTMVRHGEHGSFRELHDFPEICGTEAENADDEEGQEFLTRRLEFQKRKEAAKIYEPDDESPHHSHYAVDHEVAVAARATTELESVRLSGTAEVETGVVASLRAELDELRAAHVVALDAAASSAASTGAAYQQQLEEVSAAAAARLGSDREVLLASHAAELAAEQLVASEQLQAHRCIYDELAAVQQAETASHSIALRAEADEQHSAAATIQAWHRRRKAWRDARAVVKAHIDRTAELQDRAAARFAFEAASVREEATRKSSQVEATWRQAMQEGISVQQERWGQQLRAVEELAAHTAEQLVAEQAKCASLTHELERSRQMEHQWREIAWQTAHSGPARELSDGKLDASMERKLEPRGRRASGGRSPARISSPGGSATVQRHCFSPTRSLVGSFGGAQPRFTVTSPSSRSSDLHAVVLGGSSRASSPRRPPRPTTPTLSASRRAGKVAGTR